jgi:ketosteroid isomerase-like protein
LRESVVRFIRRRRSRFIARMIVVAAGVAPSATLAQARSSSSDSAAVAQSLKTFLTAFENLDWQPFCAAFSDSATVFQPAPNMPVRFTGRAAIDSTFALVFADIRAHASGGPPYHQLRPVDLRIQSLAPGVVLVTFELQNSERLARRTIVFGREATGWRIVHLHASNINR